MLRSRRNAGIRPGSARGLLFALLLVVDAGCSHWAGTPVATDPVPTEPLHVVMKNGQAFVLDGAAVVGDSLAGRVASVDLRESESVPRLTVPVGSRYAVARSDIERTEVRKGNTGATIALGVFLLALVAIVAGVALGD